MDFFNIDDCSLSYRTAAGAVGLFDSLSAEDGCTGWEIWAFDDSEQCFQQLLLAGVWVFQSPLCTGGYFTQVVRWDVGGHTHGDTD